MNDSILFIVYGDSIKTYRWQLYSNDSWGFLSDNSQFSGSQEDSLYINGLLDIADSTMLRCIVENDTVVDTSSVGFILIDHELPVLTVTADTIVLELDHTGKAVLIDTVVVKDASDNCMLADTILSQYEFTCSEVDDTTKIKVMLYDAVGNVSVDSVYVIVLDTIKAKLICENKNRTIAEGELSYSVSETEFDPNISVLCNYTLVNDFNDTNTLHQAAFPIGTTIVQWILTDRYGIADTCVSEVIVTTAVTDLPEISSNNLLFSPNPTSGVVYFDFNGMSVNRYEIHDLSGKTIIQKTEVSQNEQVDLSAYSKGMYFVIIYSNNTVYTHKLLKK